MKSNPKRLISLLALSIIVLSAFIVWSISESEASYKEPQEALLAENEDLVLIPAYVTQDEALFFFIRNETSLGAAKVYKNLWGWKSDFLTWGPFNSITTGEKIGGYQIHGDEVIFGLMQKGDERVVMLNNTPAPAIPLELSLPDEIDNEHLSDLSLWYFETDELANESSLTLVERNTNEEIDTLHIPPY